MKENIIAKRIIGLAMAFALILSGIWLRPQEVSAKEYGVGENMQANDLAVGNIINTGTNFGVSSNQWKIVYKFQSWMGDSYTVNISNLIGGYCQIGYDYYDGTKGGELTSKYSKWRIESVSTNSSPYTLVLAPYIFKVTYQLAGQTIDPVEVTPNTTTTAPTVSVEEGYRIKWYKDSSYSTEWNFASDKVTSDMTLYGRKEAANSTATFITEGSASNMPQPQTIAIGGTVTKPDEIPIRAGYTFKGWYADQQCNTAFDFTQTYGAGNSIKVYAGWTANSYNVTFDAKGGNCSSTEKTVTYEASYGELPAPAKTGYKFAGWYTDETFSNQVTDTTNVSTASDHVLYAKWTANTYKIKFDSNGGTGSMDEQSISYGTPTNLTINSFSMIDHRFNGWNTSADGTGTAYTNGQEVMNLTVYDGAEITLYAQWGEKIVITSENLHQNLNFSLSAKEYDGNAQNVEVTPQPGVDLGAITVKYYDKTGTEISQSGLKNAGTYTIKVDVAEGADNKAVSGLIVGTFTIEKRKVTITAADKNSVYGAAVASLTASVTGNTGLVNSDDLGVICAECDVTSASAAGTYKIVPTYTANPNYDVTVVNGTYTVTKKTQQTPSGFSPVGVSYYNGTKDTADGVISGVTDAMEYRREGEITYTSVPGGATSISGLPAGTYYIRYKEKDNEQASADVIVVITKKTEDTTAPIVTIKHGDNTINKILNTITFGRFFKDTTKFVISATDDGSGIDKSKYAYYLDENPGTSPMSEQEIAKLPWITGAEISVNPEKRFVLYVKAEDKVGNVSYAYTDGIHVVKSNGYVSVKDLDELQKALEQGFNKIKVEADIVITDDMAVTIPQGGKIIVSQNVTLENNGTINGSGTIINNGSIVNNGTIDITGYIANSSGASVSGSGSSTAGNAQTIIYGEDTKNEAVSGDTVIQVGSGTVTMEIKSLDKNGTTSGNLVEGLSVSQVEKILKGCLTDDERAAVENGQDVKVKVTVTLLESSASDNEKSAMQTALAILNRNGYTAGMADYLDIIFEKKIGGADWTKITNLSDGVEITMNIPEAYQKEGRIFYVVRNHNGQCEILSDKDADSKTVTFTTDRFSTYALAYVDASSGNQSGTDKDNDNNGNDDNSNNNSYNSKNNITDTTVSNTTANAEPSTTEKSVKTGDSAMPMVWFAVLLVSGCLIFSSRKRERR